MIRLFNKLYALCAIAACTILYSAWFLTSRNFGDIVPLKSEQFQVAEDFDQRLVVFGDSWSDNETEELQGKVWTDWLCEMVRLPFRSELVWDFFGIGCSASIGLLDGYMNLCLGFSLWRGSRERGVKV